ncbi:hypothetical protein [Methylocystis sp.]|uniref:hypothetical protein n=1 Tax=Methylocystis sp. TaxID=1911079 RepID=UPI002732E4CE|nr:hypothetical protein [Methylocystis sp.]
MVSAAIAVAGAALTAAAGEPGSYLQKDISTAKIVETSRGYAVDVSILASDFEEMFQKSFNERRGVDLSVSGALEREIGRFVAERITMRGGDGTPCPGKVERSGEDPGNDEGVRVSMTFECPSHDAVYDANKLLATHSSRAWQVVTISRGDAHGQAMVQAMINAESPPVRLAEFR